MDTEDGLITVLSTASYGARARETIEEFCCDILIDITNLPPKDMDTAITNIHKSLANHSTVAREGYYLILEGYPNLPKIYTPLSICYLSAT